MATVPTAETSALPASLSHLLTEAQWSELKASGRRRLRLAAAEVEAATADEPARARALQRLQSMVDGALSAAQLRPKSTPGAAVLRAAKPASAERREATMAVSLARDGRNDAVRRGQCKR